MTANTVSCRASLMPSRRAHGFTLVEVLVALVVMSIMALLSWQGIDGMARANNQHRARADDVAAIQTTLLQWRTDLDHMMEAGQTPPGALATAARAIEFDGRILRITRRFTGDEVRVVAWGSRRVDTSTGASSPYAHVGNGRQLGTKPLAGAKIRMTLTEPLKQAS
jgi:prepilin-type N-terminal cleavage/methylation domain-containing protein